MEKVRLNKYLATLGIASRREIDRMIEREEIKVNDGPAEHGAKVDDNDKISINGKIIDNAAHKKVYYMLNKPMDVLSAAKDIRGRKTVVELIPCQERIFPIGRLDHNTTGLILLTNDGELFNRIVHPKAQVFKEYHAVVKGNISDKELEMLERGVLLDDGITLPAKVHMIKRDTNKTELRISIREGRNRQIRRMMLSIGHRVISLSREKIGELSLGNLPIGNYRELTNKEIKYLYNL